jgi:hypothetical protein
MADEISLREYFERILELQSKALGEYKVETLRAIGEAAASMEKRLDKLNELRQEVIQDRSLMVLRVENDRRLEAIGDRISAVEKWQNKVVGIGIVFVLLSGLIGAMIGKLLFGK